MMVDREKVLRGLEHCCDPDRCDAGCPYYKDYDDVYECMSKLAGDALSLLQEQEAVEPKIQTSHDGKGTWWYVCGMCNTAINPNDKFCPECGMKVKLG